MPLLDMEMDLQKIPPAIYRELIDELSENSAWKLVAEYLVEKCSDRFSVSWFKSLERESRFTNPKRSAELLIDELITGLCTVRILCTILKNCDIGYALYLLRGHGNESKQHYSLLTVKDRYFYPLDLPSIESLEITSQPRLNADGRSPEIAIGEMFVLSCKATGLPPPRYQWMHENEELIEHRTSDLSLLITSPDQAGDYRCRVDHYDRDERRLDEKYSEYVTLRIKSVPVTITVQPLPVDVIVGDNFILSCEATGYPTPRYQWFKANVMLKDETSNTYRRTNACFKDEDTYYCHVTNGASDSVSNKIKVTVDPPAGKALAKIALLIGNNDYINIKKLSKPENDVVGIGEQLQKIGFHVVCLKNMTRVEMKNAIDRFSRALIPGVYGFFYFAGHGMSMHDPHMEPIDTPKLPCLQDTICVKELLEITLRKNPACLVVVLDMCREVPDKEENKQIHNEHPKLIEYNNNKNYILAYSTCNFEPSLEGEKAKNGVYASHLIKHITEPKPALKVFAEVARSVGRSEIGGFIQAPETTNVQTKPYRLTDAIDSSKPLNSIVQTVIRDTTFKPLMIHQNYECSGKSWRYQLRMEPLNPPFLNGLRIIIPGAGQYYIEFLRYNDPTECDLSSLSQLRKNQWDITSERDECRIYNPQRHNLKAGLLILMATSKDHLSRSMNHGRFPYMEKLPAILKDLNRRMPD